jgi:lysozyme family protein
MNKLSKYNEFLIEKEFKSIIKDILTLVESNTYEWDLTNKEDKVNVGDTIVWDAPSKKNDVIKDEPAKEIVWDFTKDVEQQSKSIKDYVNSLRSGASKVKSGLGKVRSKLHKFKNYLNDADADIEFDIKSAVFKRIEEFIKGLNTKEELKKYFFQFLEELKELPYKVKKDLFVKLSVLIMTISSLPIGDLISDKDASKDKFLSDVKTEVELVSINKVEKTEVSPVKEVEKNKSKYAKFEKAHKIVMAVEAGYSGDRADKGNYTSCKGESIFIGTNHGIAAPTLIVSDVLPRGNTNDEYKTSPEKIKELFTMSYGNNYDKLCGKGEKTFKEQWKLDQKHIVDEDDIEYKWNQIMRHLSKENALDIYQKDYWTPQGLDKFKSQSIANVLYDGCVNQGPGATIQVLKNSMENLGHDTEGIDGWNDFHEKLTPTVNDMNKTETKKLFEEIKEERMVKYRGAETWDDHGKGWTDRVEKLTFMDDNTKDLDIS